MEKKMLRETDVSWAAGFFEGEGSLSVTKDFTLHARVPQVDREPLDRLRELFGGNIRNKCASGNRKPCLEWSICNAAVIRLLLAIQKFVVRTRIKDRIRMAMEFQEIKADRSRPKEERRKQQEALYWAFKQHNKAGAVQEANKPRE